MNNLIQRAFLLFILPPMWLADLTDDAIGRATWRRAWRKAWRDCPMPWRDSA